MKSLTERSEKNQQRARRIHDGRSGDPSRDRAEWRFYLRITGTHPGARAHTRTHAQTPRDSRLCVRTSLYKTQLSDTILICGNGVNARELIYR